MASRLVGLAAFALGAAFSAIALGDWRGPDSFEECVLADVRGIPDRAVDLVYQFCRDRFPEPATKSLLSDDQMFGGTTE